MRRLALALLLLAPAAARAGGPSVLLAAQGGLVWATAGTRIVAVDARSGPIRRSVRLPEPYVVAVAPAPDAVWAASVDGFFSASSLSLLDARSTATAIRLPSGPISDLAAGGGAVWALAGAPGKARILRVDIRTHRVRYSSIRRPRALAGDGTTAVATTADGRLFVLGAASRPVRVPEGSAPLAVDRHGAWVASGSILQWVSLPAGRPRTILDRAVAAVAVAGGRAFALLPGRGSVDLVRFDEDGGRILARRRLPPYADDVAVAAGGLWVGESGAAPTLLELDPLALARRRIVRLPSS